MEGRFDTKHIVCLLKSCVKIEHLEEFYVKMCEKRCLSQMDVCIANTLIDMYAKHGSLEKAQEVFDELVLHDVVSWNVLISAYAKHNDHAREAMSYFLRMKHNGFSPNVVTYISALKACSNVRSIHECKRVHAAIVGKDLLASSLILGNALVDMYGKCGLLAHAREVFDNLPMQDVISWNVLMTGYVKHDHYKESLHCFEQMQCKEICPNPVTFICILKACGKLKEINLGMRIHEILREKLLHRECALGNALIDMYAKCGFPVKSQETFNELPTRDIISWTTIISAHATNEQMVEALEHFEQMRVEGVAPNAFTFVCALKACSRNGAIHKGIQIHAEISNEGLLERDHIVANALVDLYASCGHLPKAWEVFAKLPNKTLLSWNILIGGYSAHDCSEEVLRCAEEMQRMSIAPNSFTFLSILRACSSLSMIEKGIETHAEIARKGFLCDIHILGNALIDMYCNCSMLTKAQEVFNNLLVQDIVSWTTLIAGYAKHDFSDEVLCCTNQMQLEGIFPDAVTFIWSLKACTNLRALHEGTRIHVEIARMGWLEWDVVIGSTLVEMYAKCYSLRKAQEVFDMLPVRDVGLWNALLAAYCEYGHYDEALSCYNRMQCDGVSPDVVTFLCCLKACGRMRAIDKGRELHGEIFQEGLLYKDLAIGNALVNMYAEFGSLREAVEVFDMIPERDIISWNTLITGYTNHNCGEEVLNSYNHMQYECVSANIVTFVCVLKACGSIGAGNQGRDIHAEIYKKGVLVGNLMVENALIYMYAKCGMLERALDVFDKLPMHDAISWTSLIAGYTDLGESGIVLEMFESMVGEGIRPDAITFVGVLSACSHGGLVDKALMYFKMMSMDYGIHPTLEHYTCIIGLLGRTGHLAKMLTMIHEMPFDHDLVLLQSVLDACKMWGNIEFGESIFTKAAKLVEDDMIASIPVCGIGTRMEVYASSC